MADAGPGRRRNIYLYFGVDLELMRHAVVPWPERTHQGHFVGWVDFRERRGMPVFLHQCSDGMFNVWQLFVYVSYSFATKQFRPPIVESHLSAIKLFHRIMRGFELYTTHPVLASALKQVGRTDADVDHQATVRRPVSWMMLLASGTLAPSWGTGGHEL